MNQKNIEQRIPKEAIDFVTDFQFVKKLID